MRRKSALALVLGLVGLAALAISWDIRHRELSRERNDRPALGFRLPRLDPPLEKRAEQRRDARTSDRVVLRIGGSEQNLSPDRLRAAAAAIRPSSPPLQTRRSEQSPAGPRPPRQGPPKKPAPGRATKHVVQKGELLGTISSQHYGTIRYVERIKEANGLTSDLIQVGQELIIPAIDAQPSGEAPRSDEIVGPDPKRTYKVRPGDSLTKIAADQLGNAGRWKELQALNRLPDASIREGQLLLLPNR